MRDGNFFCAVEGHDLDRDKFFSAYKQILERRSEFNACILTLPDGREIGVSYLAAHPKTEKIINRNDVFLSESNRRALFKFGIFVEWDQYKVMPLSVDSKGIFLQP